MTVFEFTLDPDRNALIRRALAKRILRQQEIEEEEASTEEDESFLGKPIARRKQPSSRQSSQDIDEGDTQHPNTTAISVTVTQPNGATTTASRAAARDRHANGPKDVEDEDEASAAIEAASIESPNSNHGDGMKHKNRWKNEYLRATSESSQTTERGSSPTVAASSTIADAILDESATNDGEGKRAVAATPADDDEELVKQGSDLVGDISTASDATGLSSSAAAAAVQEKEREGSTQDDGVAQPELDEQTILARLNELRKEKTRLFQQFKHAIAQKSAIQATAVTAATTVAPLASQVPSTPTATMHPSEGTATTSNPDAVMSTTIIKSPVTARRLSRNEVEVPYPAEQQKTDINVQDNRKKLEVEIPRDRHHSPGAEVPPSLSSAASTASSVTPYSPVNSHPPSHQHHPPDHRQHYRRPSSTSPSTTTSSTTSSSSPQFVSPSNSKGTKRSRSDDSPPPLSTSPQEGGVVGGGGGGGGGQGGSRRRPRHFDDRPPRGPSAASGSIGPETSAARKPLPTYPGLPSKPQIRQPYPGGGGNKYGGGDGGRERGGRGSYNSNANISNSSINSGSASFGMNGASSSIEGKHALPRRPFIDENRSRGSGVGGGGPSSISNPVSSGSGLNTGSNVNSVTGRGGVGVGGSYPRGGGSGSGSGGHSSLPDRPLLDYRPVLGGPQGRPLPFSRSMMQMPRPGGFLPGRPPTLMRPVWPRRGSRS